MHMDRCRCQWTTAHWPDPNGPVLNDPSQWPSADANANIYVGYQLVNMLNLDTMQQVVHMWINMLIPSHIISNSTR